MHGAQMMGNIRYDSCKYQFENIKFVNVLHEKTIEHTTIVPQFEVNFIGDDFTKFNLMV